MDVSQQVRLLETVARIAAALERVADNTDKLLSRTTAKPARLEKSWTPGAERVLTKGGAA